MANSLGLDVVLVLYLFLASVSSSDIPDHRYQLDHFPFEYGVASGDPLSDAVLLWTRATNFTTVVWSIWDLETGLFENNVTWGVATTGADLDYLIHVDAVGLAPRTRYAYGFEAGGFRSRIGKTKTAPAVNDSSFDFMKIATFSCACHYCGFMNAYREMAEDDSIDLVIGLGDWLYTPPGTGCGRVPAGMCFESSCELTEVEGFPAQENCDPDGDIHRVEDMRYYHKTLSLDVDVRALRAAHPMINIPDNHDINDDLTTNLTASPEIIAWLEWVPTRYSLDADGTLFFPRRFRYGPLLDIVRMDTRNIGMDEDPPSYLGQAQIDFFENEVFGSTKTDGWRVICSSQVFMPWTIQESGWIPIVYSIVSIIAAPLLLFILICIGVRLRRHQLVARSKKNDYEDEKKGMISNYSQEFHSEKASSKLNDFANKMGGFCISRVCIAVTCIIVAVLFILAIVGVEFVRDYVRKNGISSNASGIPNIQSSRERAWDGVGNPKDRSEFLAQMKRLDAKNNIFVTGDMHMSLAADVYDTAPGIGPPELIPDETTRFGVEFLSSSVSRGNLDERVGDEFGDAVLPLVQWFFEATFYASNPHFKFFESVQHGYGLIELTPNEAKFYWFWQRYDVYPAPSELARTLTVKKDENRYE